MKKLFESIKQRFQGSDRDFAEDGETEYVQLDTAAKGATGAKVIVRPFVLTDFNETKQVLDALRNQDTVALINIQPLKDKDIVELKRAINKLKKTVDAIGGDIAGFGDDYIVIAPSFATIWRAPAAARKAKTTKSNSFADLSFRILFVTLSQVFLHNLP